MKKNRFKIISIIVFLVAMVLLTIVAIPLIKTHKNPAEFQAFVEGYGRWSMFIMLFLQIAQVIVAFIPGEAVEFVAGTLYGWFGGWAFCSVGILIGQALIFQLVRVLGKDFAEKVAGSDKIKRFKFLENERKLKTIIFILFFIPGTPKDLLTYVAPLTKISLRDFLIITTVARIPSVISSTYAGSAFSDRNYLLLAAVYAVVGIVSLAGALIYHKWEEKK